MPSSPDNPITYIAKTDFRGKFQSFGIYQKDRLYHTYILGKTGTGKTTLLESLITQDIRHGRGLCLIDIHGDLAERMSRLAGNCRESDLIYVDPGDPQCPFGYNPIRPSSNPSLTVSFLLESLERLWGGGAWGPKLAHILRKVFLTLLAQAQAAFEDVLRLLSDSEFREGCIRTLHDRDLLLFWQEEFPKYGKADLLPIYNKIGSLLSYPSVKGFLGPGLRQLSLRRVMDEKRVLIVNLSKGRLGSEPAHFLASILLDALAMASFSRANITEEKRVPFMLYLDEFQHYAGKGMLQMLSELRKYKTGMVLAHQHLSQLSPELRDAVLGNVSTIICFRMGLSDARVMEKEFYPVFQAIDFVDLPNYHIYLKLMISGKPSKGFSAKTFAPDAFDHPSNSAAL